MNPQLLSGWLDQYSIGETLEIYRELALAHLTDVDNPTAGVLRDFITRRDWASVLQVELDYTEGYSTIDYLEIRQALGFFQKLEDLDVGFDKTQLARTKFYESEKLCAQTNSVFSAFLRGGASLLPQHVPALMRARAKIAKVLGTVPPLEALRFAHGPGASTNVKRKDAAAINKFAARIQCSTNLHMSGLLPVILRQVPHWTAAHTEVSYIDDEGWLCDKVSIDITDGKLGFVPKNAKSLRTTVTEPALNMFVQKGLGDYIAECLRRVGIDTRDQSANRHFARRGSLTGDVATLDLSSASDTVSRQLVRFLLPDDWFFYLDSTRSSTIHDRWAAKEDRIVHLQKFSSMGNGFTFPLETLIFWALTSSVCSDPTRVSCYGDDIICPTENVGRVIALLDYCGFVVNTSKSFMSGCFRESCGADYFNGIDIRPYYAKHRVSPATLFVLHNFYVGNTDYEMADRIRELIHPDLQIFGPAGTGDGHLHFPLLMHGEFKDWVLPPYNRGRGWCGFRYDTFIQGPVTRKTRFPGDWVTPLYATYTRGDAPSSLYEIHREVGYFGGGKDEVERHDRYGEIWNGCSPETLRFSSTKKDGRPTWTYPGSEGYSRVSIYTLSF